MSRTKIEWTERRWNPVTGCSKVSQGCKFCYAETMAKRFWKNRKFTDILIHLERLREPIKWKKPGLVFVNSMSDLFHPSIPFQFIDLVFAVMAIAKNQTFQILTKRPERMIEYFIFKDRDWKHPGMQADERIRFQTYHQFGKGIPPNEWSWPLKNVWLGISCEGQATADARIPILIKTPAAVRFISAEPLLGPIDFDKYFYASNLDDNGIEGVESGNIDWVIAGGESGTQARPMHPDWVRSIRNQCISAKVDFFFKQWGNWQPVENVDFESDMEAESLDEGWYAGTGQNGRKYVDRENNKMLRIKRWEENVVGNDFSIYLKDKSISGRLLDGREWNEKPGCLAHNL